MFDLIIHIFSFIFAPLTRVAQKIRSGLSREYQKYQEYQEYQEYQVPAGYLQ